MSGYATRAYAETLAAFGVAIELPASRGWLLERPVPETGDTDAACAYPIFCCERWDRLDDDLRALTRPVAVSLVTDPLAVTDIAALRRMFPDVCYEYKQHFVVDLCQSSPWISRHHRYYARKAAAAVDVDVWPSPHAIPASFLDEWMRLYDALKARHRITGLRAFSRTTFARLLAIPELTVVRATMGGDLVAAQLWMRGAVDGGVPVAYSHLTGCSERGYRSRASYALYAGAIEYFRSVGVRWLSLGAEADGSAADGLATFKAGWATGRRPAHFCGRIIDRARYHALVARRGSATAFFPAYRCAYD